MTAICPKGHESTEQDFCSECGVKMTNDAGAPGAASAAASGETCPDCHTPRMPGSARFCELCGYNFETGAHGEIPLPPSTAATPTPEKWTIQVSIDPALKENGSPDPPAGFQPLAITIPGNTLLIGRKSPSRNIAPEISLDFDSAVSHRHAILTRADGAGWSLRDIGSSNGTRVNGQDVQPMTDVPVKPGDRITLGHWTCLVLSNEASS